MKRKGISLIVLIITVIIIVILASIVVLVLTNNNPVETAKEAIFKENIRNLSKEDKCR